MHKPEWAPYVGQLLAASGPPQQAEAVLDEALAQPRLIEHAAAATLSGRSTSRPHDGCWPTGCIPRIDVARARDAAFFIAQAASGKAVYLISASVMESGDLVRAAADLARIDPGSLDRAELLLNEGAVLALAGSPDAGRAVADSFARAAGGDPGRVMASHGGGVVENRASARRPTQRWWPNCSTLIAGSIRPNPIQRFGEATRGANSHLHAQPLRRGRMQARSKRG